MKTKKYEYGGKMDESSEEIEIKSMDMDCKVVFIWATAKEACDALGVSRSAVTSVIKGYQGSTKGFKFDYF